MHAFCNFVQRQPKLHSEARKRKLAVAAPFILLRKEDYVGHPVLLEQLNSGRQCVQRFEKCRGIALRTLRQKTNIVLTQDQHRLMNEARNSMLLIWYGNKVENIIADRIWLRETYQINVREYSDTVSVRFPRRIGKTLSATLTAAITMMSQRDGNVYAVNPYERQAQSFLVQVKEHLDRMADDNEFGFKLATYSEQKHLMVIKPNWLGGETTNEIVSKGGAYNAAHTAGFRGGGKRSMIIMFDEFYFFCDEAFVVLFPLVANGAALFMTSSSATHESNISEIINKCYKNGRPIVRSIDYQAKCYECANKPFKGTTGDSNIHDDICPHIVEAPNHLRDARRKERLQGLMETVGSYDTEMGNAPQRSIAMRVFNNEDVQACLGLEAATASRYTSPNCLVVGFDPGSIVERSHSAIFSFFMTPYVDGRPAIGTEVPTLDQYCVVRTIVSPLSFLLLLIKRPSPKAPVIGKVIDESLVICVCAPGPMRNVMANEVDDVNRVRWRLTSNEALHQATIREEDLARRSRAHHRGQQKRPLPGRCCWCVGREFEGVNTEDVMVGICFSGPGHHVR